MQLNYLFSSTTGILADYTSANIAIIVGIGFSILAALANSPLMWHPLMGKPKPPTPLAKRKLPGEDDDLFKQILAGMYQCCLNVFEFIKFVSHLM